MEFPTPLAASGRTRPAGCSGLPLILPWQSADAYSVYHLYAVQVDPSRTSLTRDKVFARIGERGVGVNVHYIPVHLQPYYRALGYGEGYCPVAERYYQGALSMPMFPALTNAQQETAVNALRDAISS